MGMILRIASSRIVGQGDIVGRSGYFSLNLSANSVMRGRLDARRTLKSLVADLRLSFFFRISAVIGLFSRFCEIFLFYPGKLTEIHRKILPSFLLFKKQQIFHLPSPLDARNYLAFIAAEGNVLLVNIPVSGFQFLYQLAFGKVFAT